MVQESFKALKNTNINPLITSYKTAPSPRAVFLSLHFAKGARCEPHEQETLPKLMKVNCSDNQLLLVTL